MPTLTLVKVKKQKLLVQSKACHKCRGDLFWSDAEKAWVCLQCGKRVYV